jgi:RNA polymerase sigma-70 factor (ECF subfamily)
MAQPLNNVASAKNEVSEWVNLYSDDLYAYAVKRVSDQNLAQDLVQNAFIAAYQSFDRFEGKSKPKTWLISILKNKIMDHFRQVYRRNET